jgi:hypothetical protein
MHRHTKRRIRTQKSGEENVELALSQRFSTKLFPDSFCSHFDRKFLWLEAWYGYLRRTSAGRFEEMNHALCLGRLSFRGTRHRPRDCNAVQTGIAQRR